MMLRDVRGLIGFGGLCICVVSRACRRSSHVSARSGSYGIMGPKPPDATDRAPGSRDSRGAPYRVRPRARVLTRDTVPWAFVPRGLDPAGPRLTHLREHSLSAPEARLPTSPRATSYTDPVFSLLGRVYCTASSSLIVVRWAVVGGSGAREVGCSWGPSLRVDAAGGPSVDDRAGVSVSSSSKPSDLVVAAIAPRSPCALVAVDL